MKYLLIAVAFFAFSFFSISQNSKQLDSKGQENQILLKSKLLNDTVWIIDSTVRQQNTDSGFINRERRITNSIDSKGRTVSWLNQYWNIDQSAWFNKQYDSINFINLSDLVLERLSYSWNTNENNWKIATYKRNNESGQQVLFYYKKWDDISGRYTSGYRETWDYNQYGLLSVNHWDDFNKETQEYDSRTKRTYYYNNEGQDTTYIIEKWNPGSQTWYNLIRSDFVYDELGYISMATNYSWSIDSSSWVNSSQATHTFSNQSVSDTSTYFEWLSDMEIWYPTYRSIRSYDNSNIIEVKRQDCLFPADNFGNTSRIVYVYDNGLLMEEREQVWAGDHWRDKFIDLFTYVYDTLLESQTMISYNIYNQSYDTGFRIITEYDSRPLSIKTSTQHWSSELSDFETSIQYLYYWSPFSSPDAIYEFDDLVFSIYPNPSAGIIQVKLIEPPIIDSKLIVFDLSGRVVLEKIINSKNEIVDLSSQANGTYFLQIISGKSHGIKQAIRY